MTYEEQYKYGTTGVFWDLEEFPVPRGRCVNSFRKNIEQALTREGYSGGVRIMFAYCSDSIPFSVIDHFYWIKIYILAKDQPKLARLVSMLMDMIRFVRNVHPVNGFNVIVITKDIPEEDTEFVSVLQALRDLKFNVFFVVPDDYQEEVPPPLTTATMFWRWTDLFDGKPPFRKCSDDDMIDRDSDDEDKIF